MYSTLRSSEYTTTTTTTSMTHVVVLLYYSIWWNNRSRQILYIWGFWPLHAVFSKKRRGEEGRVAVISALPRGSNWDKISLNSSNNSFVFMTGAWRWSWRGRSAPLLAAHPPRLEQGKARVSREKEWIWHLIGELKGTTHYSTVNETGENPPHKKVGPQC
jgi:hypothetical protein